MKLTKEKAEQEAWKCAVELAMAWDKDELPRNIVNKLKKENFPFIKYLKEFNELEKQMGYKRLTKWRHQIYGD